MTEHVTFWKWEKKKKKKPWKVAKFTDKTKESIFERDGSRCIVCWDDKLLTAHHCYYWTESNRAETRNDIDQGCSLCAICHGKAHACSVWDWVREECIKYLKDKYDSTTRKSRS